MCMCRYKTYWTLKNIISVYRATGNPEDDGYLTSSAAQNAIDAQNECGLPLGICILLAVNNPTQL